LVQDQQQFEAKQTAKNLNRRYMYLQKTDCEGHPDDIKQNLTLAAIIYVLTS